MKLTAAHIKKFQTKIWEFYSTQKRDFVWRKKINPYYVVVSEIMLQQTQTTRVAEKFPAFIKIFPDFTALARATPAQVIIAWQGLGYNRRALFLHELSKKVVSEYKGKLPQNPDELITLSGIGKNTAGSIMAFAFNKPVVFIETNIRSVFLHEFFTQQTAVPDTELLPLIEATISKDNPREWYYALMDYGVKLKRRIKILAGRANTTINKVFSKVHNERYEERYYVFWRKNLPLYRNLRTILTTLTLNILAKRLKFWLH